MVSELPITSQFVNSSSLRSAGSDLRFGSSGDVSNEDAPNRDASNDAVQRDAIRGSGSRCRVTPVHIATRHQI